MITLNLISPKQKKYLKTCFWQKSAQKVFIAYLLAIVISAGFCLAINNRLEKLDAQLNQQSKSDQEIINQTRSVVEKTNSQINQLESLKPSDFSWSKYLANLDAVIPSSIKLSKLDITLDGQQIFIQGYAENRSNFLEFQKSLENSKLINNIYAPLNNLLQETKVNFVISGKVNL